MPQQQLSQIVIGERVRKDMGDIESLAESMKRHGLLHPIVVKKDGTLVAGHRRIEAAKRIGWKDIPVTVIEVGDLLSAERDENAERKDFTPTEAVEIGKLIEEEHKAKIEAQKSEMGRQNRLGKDLLKKQVLQPVGGTRQTAAKAVGMSPITYYRAKKVVEAAEADSENFGDLPAKMDETNVTGAHRELERRKGKKDKNGKKPRHAVLRKMHYPKPNREVQRSVWALDGICDVLSKLPFDQLDATKTKEWSIALKKSAAIITRTARRLSHVKTS